MIADGREKLVQQITMRRMEFDDFEPGRQRAPGSGLERRDYSIDFRLVQGLGHRRGFGEWDSTWADDRPAALLGRQKALPSFPRQLATRLAAGVRQLDA